MWRSSVYSEKYPSLSWGIMLLAREKINFGVKSFLAAIGVTSVWLE
jgi:hypothetical protein